jgi:hypothetical protein
MATVELVSTRVGVAELVSMEVITTRVARPARPSQRQASNSTNG